MDCKPVQLIFSNPKSKPSARIEQWNLRLQGYRFEVIHTKGSQNPSDFLSRHTTLKEPKREERMAEDYVNYLAVHALPKAMTMKQFARIKEELTVNAESNLILRGSRIVIPASLQQRAIDIAHEGHQGMVKTKKLL